MRRSDLRFTISGLLLVMLIFSVLAAAGSYLVNAIRGDVDELIIFFPFVLIAPMGLMILVSLLRQFLIVMNRRRPRAPADRETDDEPPPQPPKQST